MLSMTETLRNQNADGTLIATGDAFCTIHAELVETDSGAKMIRLNCTTPWDTWVGVDLTVDQFREAARAMLAFADEVDHAANPIS